MTQEKILTLVRKTTPFLSVVSILVVGVIHAFNIDKIPASSGLELVIDLVRFSVTDPLSILEGVLVYGFFHQLSAVQPQGTSIMVSDD
ncbi:MAG: hypothetical protein NWE89_07215 [Candidatus Bathyarchaeota archaeon]|nr:hypothetical protein [Candidatus Bathyarchaeota archaeon]